MYSGADARRLYHEIAKEEYLVPAGMSSHIGSQILELTPFMDAVRSLKSMILELRGDGISLTMMDIGGGLGITYKDELPPSPEKYAKVIEKELKGMGLTLILEPGRVLVGNSGIFVTKVLYVKKVPEKTFYVVDGAMNDLVRPSLYNAYHEIKPVEVRKDILSKQTLWALSANQVIFSQKTGKPCGFFRMISLQFSAPVHMVIPCHLTTTPGGEYRKCS